MNLGDLKDVSLEDPISSSDVLVYNEQTKHWENRALEDLLETYNPTTSVKVDEASIEFVNEQLQLKDFGTGYFAYVPAVKDEQTGEIKTPSTYEYTEGFKSGLEVRVVPTSDGKWSLAWYEPGTETVEDVATNIEAISKDVKALEEIVNGEDGLSKQVETLQTDLGSTNETVSELSDKVNTKADAESVYTKTEIDTTLANIYTKTETDTAIGEAIAAAGHLKRKKLNSGETIDVTAEDADQYIYMVPTGLTEDDDKYDEYMVIDGIVEKVGSWEVNLNNYATTKYVDDELAKKVDVKTGERLITDAEATKLEGIEEGAQKNYITAVDENNFTVVDGTLQLQKVTSDQVSGLNAVITDVNNLNNIINGYTNENNEQVKGLTETISELTTKVTSLEQANTSLSDTYVKKTIFNSTVSDLTTLILNNETDITNLTTRVDNVEKRLEWQGIEDEEGGNE